MVHSTKRIKYLCTWNCDPMLNMLDFTASSSLDALPQQLTDAANMLVLTTITTICALCRDWQEISSSNNCN